MTRHLRLEQPTTARRLSSRREIMAWAAERRRMLTELQRPEARTLFDDVERRAA